MTDPNGVPVGTDVQSHEMGDVQALVEEFIGKLNTIENEMQLLKDDKKELIEEYKEKLDMKSLQMAIRISNIKKKAEHKDTLEEFEEALSRIG